MLVRKKGNIDTPKNWLIFKVLFYYFKNKKKALSFPFRGTKEGI
tara:strand:+ start:96 stop:227 length:132 start_codon:yes stop_codon:yes gene_type:complete